MRNFWSFIFLHLIIVSCSSDSSLLDEPTTTIEYKYLEHNQWIYSEMNENYLWREDLPDSIDCDYGLTPPDFFKSLLSSKDRFSYMQERIGRATTQHLGFAYQAYRTIKGDIVLYVLYVNSPNARKSGLKRGDFVKIKSVSGKSVVVSVIEPKNKIHTIKELYYELESSEQLNNTVLLDTIYSINNKRIGYLCYLKFDKPEDLYHAFRHFKDNNISELVLDLRYNPGGYVDTAKKLCSLIVNSSAYGKIFQQYSYNSIIAMENLKLYGNERTFSYFETPNNDSLPILGIRYDFLSLNKIYILTSSHTASASEATICCLKPYMNVTTIGATTVGKGVGMQTISSNKFRYSLTPITFQYYNSVGETVPNSGIEPDYLLEDTYYMPKSEIGDITEPLLSKALELITSSPLTHTYEYSIYPDYSLTPIGEPSYVTEFKNKHNNESN